MTAIGMLAMTSAAMAQVTNNETSGNMQEQQMTSRMDSLDAVFDSLELKGVTVTAQKPLVKMEADKMTYDVADTSIITVSKSGIITPKSVGTTTVTVTIGDNLSFTVKVTVLESRD